VANNKFGAGIIVVKKRSEPETGKSIEHGMKIILNTGFPKQGMF